MNAPRVLIRQHSIGPFSTTAFNKASHRRHIYVKATSNSDSPQPDGLNARADAYTKGLKDGQSEDDAAAQQMGAANASQLTEVQDKYKDAIKEKLQQRAEELKKEREARAVKFNQGRNAYAKGEYRASVVLLESALNEEGPFSQLGGEIQLWLAEAYLACGREEDCIQTYRTLETTHPIPSIKRQAASLRYIVEAPKLEISEDEKVSIPLLEDLNPNKSNRGIVAPRPVAKRPKKPQTWDEKFWENYEPPVYLTNRYVWAAAVVVSGILIWYSIQAAH